MRGLKCPGEPTIVLAMADVRLIHGEANLAVTEIKTPKEYGSGRTQSHGLHEYVYRVVSHDPSFLNMLDKY
jgi:hypothetical protein